MESKQNKQNNQDTCNVTETCWEINIDSRPMSLKPAVFDVLITKQ